MMEGISLEKKEGYAILSVDIPQTRNALSVPIVEYMDTLVDSVIADKDIHCLVITGGGEKSCGGSRHCKAGENVPGRIQIFH